MNTRRGYVLGNRSKKGKLKNRKLNERNIFLSRDRCSCRAKRLRTGDSFEASKRLRTGDLFEASKRLRTGDLFEASKRLRTRDSSVKRKSEK